MKKLIFIFMIVMSTMSFALGEKYYRELYNIEIEKQDEGNWYHTQRHSSTYGEFTPVNETTGEVVKKYLEFFKSENPDFKIREHLKPVKTEMIQFTYDSNKRIGFFIFDENKIYLADFYEESLDELTNYLLLSEIPDRMSVRRAIKLLKNKLNYYKIQDL